MLQSLLIPPIFLSSILLILSMPLIFCFTTLLFAFFVSTIFLVLIPTVMPKISYATICNCHIFFISLYFTLFAILKPSYIIIANNRILFTLSTILDPVKLTCASFKPAIYMTIEDFFENLRQIILDYFAKTLSLSYKACKHLYKLLHFLSSSHRFYNLLINLSGSSHNRKLVDFTQITQIKS